MASPPRRVSGPLRGLFVLAWAAALPGCGGSGAFPTLDDYAHGTARLVDEVRPLFTAPGPGAAVPTALSEVAALAGRWTAASARGEVDLRLVDFRLETARRARLEVQVRLRGFAAGSLEEPPESALRCMLDATLELVAERPAREAAWALAGSRVLSAGTLLRSRPHLLETAAARGLSVVHETLDPVEATNICMPATHHHPGVLLVDVDGDLDLDVLQPSLRPRLFRNDGHGRFQEATAGSGLDTLPPGEAAGGAAADLTGDGLPELFLTGHLTPSRILENLGGGRFRDVTDAWGLAALDGPYTSAAFFDADRDGRVDLFAACYGDARTTGPSFSGRNGAGDRFFHNQGAGGRPFFVDATRAAGLSGGGWSFAVSACDFDDDGDDDLYLANDFGVNALYENRSGPGQPRFVDIARAAGAEDEGYGMGVTWGDYDLDGRWDLHVTDFWSPYRWILRDRRWPMPPLPGAALLRPSMARKMTRRSRGDALLRNLGSRRFAHVSEAAGVADGDWAWGTEFVDLDGKGREDLVVVNGMWEATTGPDDEITFWNAMARSGVDFKDGVWGTIDFGAGGMSSRRPKRLFWNRGDGTFQDRAFVEGFDTRAGTRGLAYGDLDGDGAPELVAGVFRGPTLLYENRWGAGPGSGRLRVLLSLPSGTNRDALGTVVRLTSGGTTQLREVRAGSSFLSQSSRELLFGLGAAPVADRIEVRWPDGRRDRLENVPAQSRVLWTQGEAPRILPGAGTGSSR